MRVGLTAGFVLLLVAGCSRATVPVMATEQPPPRDVVLPLSIHWARNSAEHRALYLQAYRVAGERIGELARGRALGTWAVVMDADETVLDNSTYQKERAQEGEGFTSESWASWIRRVEATALPGSAGFIERVRRLGGRVAIVTNRDDEVCPETRTNLMQLGIPVDVVLCRRQGESDKNPRFEQVRNGTAAPGVPPLEILMWVGDNIQDFPGLDQNIRMFADSAFAEFGGRYIVLPNPMYGSFEQNRHR